jgi:short subunit dehydrogenase-like uncharacterized protein
MAERGICVLGATGYTGRLVVNELHRRGVRCTAAGRSAEKLQALAHDLNGTETRVADVHDPASLAALAQSSRVIINCVGPFVDHGEPVVKAAIEHGAHYLDTTGEQPFLKAMLAHDGSARERKVAVVSAQACEIALSDCAAALAARDFRELAAVHVFYAASFHASQGTQRTVLRMLQSPGYQYLRGDWVEEAPGRIRRSIDLPAPLGRCTALSFPSAEIITLPRHLNTREVRVFFALPPWTGSIAGSLVPWLRLLMQTPLSRFAQRMIGTGTGGPDEATRATDTFQIVIELRGIRAGHAAVKRVVVSGRDPYGITAVVAAAGAVRMLAADYDRCGVLPPAKAFVPEALLAECEPFGVNLRDE